VALQEWTPGSILPLFDPVGDIGGMTASFDFIVACHPGMVLRTRDRSAATILRVAVDEGLVYGEVHMFGPCVWRGNGLYRDAPAGAAGPLDLQPPDATAAVRPPKTVSMKEALEPANRPFCCD
jgi:hypothetical protein